jgi:hypothetical protein
MHEKPRFNAKLDGDFFSFLNSFSCPLFVFFPYFFSLSRLSSLFAFIVQHTQHKHPRSRGIQTRNASKRAAVTLALNRLTTGIGINRI